MESYTTTFNILYSSDDYIFSYIQENNKDIVKVKQLLMIIFIYFSL